MMWLANSAKKYWKAILVAVILIATAWGGWRLRDLQAEEERAEMLQEQNLALIEQEENLRIAHEKILSEAQRKADEQRKRSEEYQRQLAALRNLNDKLKAERIKEYAAPAYTSCVVPADGLRNLNDDLRSFNRAGKAALPR